MEQNNLTKIYLAGFVIDYGLYAAFVAVPFKAISLGATPLHLGALPAISFASYTVSALGFGRLSDQVSRLTLGRLGCGVFAFGCVLLSFCPSIASMMLTMPLLGFGLGMFWPPVQAAIADYSRAETLEKNLGTFNVWWSLGKGLAFLTGAFLISWKGFSIAFYLAALLSSATILSLPTHRRGRTPQTVISGAPKEARGYLLLGWTGNALAFGIAATLNHHLPKLLKENGYDERRFGIILGTVFALQTLSFLALKLSASWKYNKRLFYATELVMGVSVLLLARVDVLLLALLFGAFVGMGLGLTYYASIFYSLHTDIGRGKNTGIHEAVLGAGNFLIPLLGGVVATTFSNLQAPYIVCFLLALLCIGMQEYIFRRVRGS